MGDAELLRDQYYDKNHQGCIVRRVRRVRGRISCCMINKVATLSSVGYASSATLTQRGKGRGGWEGTWVLRLSRSMVNGHHQDELCV